MKKLKGNTISAPLAILALVILIVIGVYLSLAFQRNKQEQNQSTTPTVSSNQENPTSTQPSEPSDQTEPSDSSDTSDSSTTSDSSDESDSTADWQSYKNDQYGFEFKYPKDWEINSNPDLQDAIIAIEKIGSSSKDVVGLKGIYLYAIGGDKYEKDINYFKYPSWPFTNTKIKIVDGEADYWSGSSASTLSDYAYIPQGNQYFELYTSTEDGGTEYDKVHNEKVSLLKLILASFKFTD